MTPIENRILLSELKTIKKKSDLKHLINFVISEGLEGLVLKVKIKTHYRVHSFGNIETILFYLF